MTPSRLLNQSQAAARFGPLVDTYAASLQRADPLAELERLRNLARFAPVAAAPPRASGAGSPKPAPDAG